MFLKKAASGWKSHWKQTDVWWHRFSLWMTGSTQRYSVTQNSFPAVKNISLTNFLRLFHRNAKVVSRISLESVVYFLHHAGWKCLEIYFCILGLFCSAIVLLILTLHVNWHVSSNYATGPNVKWCDLLVKGGNTTVLHPRQKRFHKHNAIYRKLSRIITLSSDSLSEFELLSSDLYARIHQKMSLYLLNASGLFSCEFSVRHFKSSSIGFIDR